MAFSPKTIEMKRGDTGPILSDVIEDDNGPIDLTGCTVKIFAKTDVLSSTPLKINGTCTVNADQVNFKGAITYSWAAGDCDTVDKYYFEYQITTAGGKIETCPTGANRYHVLLVTQDLG